ncbi:MULTISPECIES: helix-turn-helix domain-containing protein [unclassified Streptomyces]|uniref:Helix-turn-helix domain-containing protein n=1 Tax=Streptomyces sp. NBC_00060 TaxID=2975636 RepID=A0AAU2HDT9_9ACTN
MAGAKGRGRGWRPLRAQTHQAAELATFLRALMDEHGITVRALAEATRWGKSTISDNLDGRVPSKQFVTGLVQAVVREPRKRDIDLKQAWALWEAADKPPAPPSPHSGASGGALAVRATQEELISLTRQTLDLERERAGTHQLVLLLMRLVSTLQTEVAHAREVPDARAKLKALEDQLHTAQVDLERARQAREEAELLADRAQQQSTALQEELAQLRAAAPPITIAFRLGPQDLPAELQEEYFLADPDRALRTAEAMLVKGAEHRSELEGSIAPADPWQARQVGEGWLLVALVLGRVLGCLLMMVGASLHYALKTWVTSSTVWLGFPDLLVLVGIALLYDPWDIVWDTARPLLLRLIGDRDEPVVWPLTVEEALTRALRLPWAVAAATATVLSLATVSWWSLWLLAATVPAALGTMAYTVLGRNRPVVALVAPVLSSGLAVLRPLLPGPAATGAMPSQTTATER